MEVVNIIKVIKGFFSQVLNMNCRVLGVLRTDEGWKAECEVIVDEEYTTRRGLGDIVEIFEVFIGQDQEVTGYELKSTKRRALVE